mmetsp:Transcript_81001/g.160519  ORF Transcript_81001/g.160519 Transcript_81001/m.160519 type:complete len:204 (-) Transcript_81001:37-648(-)
MVVSLPPRLRPSTYNHNVLQTDSFLRDEAGDYHFTPERAAEAKLWICQFIKDAADRGVCRRIIVICGCPAVGKSAWLRIQATSSSDGTFFVEDLLYSPSKRAEFLENLRSIGVTLPVEAVAIERDYEVAMVSMQQRADGFQMPVAVMERYQSLYSRPSITEGFAKVRVLINSYNDATGNGGYSIIATEPPGGNNVSSEVEHPE